METGALDTTLSVTVLSATASVVGVGVNAGLTVIVDPNISSAVTGFELISTTLTLLGETISVKFSCDVVAVKKSVARRNRSVGGLSLSST